MASFTQEVLVASTTAGHYWERDTVGCRFLSTNLKAECRRKKKSQVVCSFLGWNPTVWLGEERDDLVLWGGGRGDHTTRVRRGAESCLRHACRMNYKLGNIQSSPSSHENWSQPQGMEGAFTVRYSFRSSSDELHGLVLSSGEMHRRQNAFWCPEMHKKGLFERWMGATGLQSCRANRSAAPSLVHTLSWGYSFSLISFCFFLSFWR